MEEEIQTKSLSNLLRYIISIAVVVIIGVVFGLIRYFNAYRGTSKTILEFFADVTSVTGLIGLLVWLLMLVSMAGAFDMIVYGTKKMFFAIFKKNPRSGLPRTYREYIEIKHNKERNYQFPFLIVASIVLLVGIILLVIHYSI